MVKYLIMQGNSEDRNMALEFCSFASGSSGNCYLVRSEETNLLIDVGIAGKRIYAGLDQVGVLPEDIDAILITHEHIDHVRSIRMIGKAAKKAKVIGSPGTLREVESKLPEGRAVSLTGEKNISIGDIEVRIFPLSHDAVEPLGYSFRKEGKQISIVTDTGYISEEIFCQIKDSDLLVLEANHEVNILQMGSYPYSLKRRILGDRGHLSNETAAICLVRLLEEREEGREIPKVLLAHLSKENNTPKQAYLTIRNILFEENYYIGKDLEMEVIPRDEVSQIVKI